MRWRRRRHGHALGREPQTREGMRADPRDRFALRAAHVLDLADVPEQLRLGEVRAPSTRFQSPAGKSRSAAPRRREPAASCDNESTMAPMFFVESRHTDGIVELQPLTRLPSAAGSDSSTTAA